MDVVMNRCFVVFAALALAVAGCGRKQPVDKVTYVADNDPRMNAAMETARSTVNSFITALQSPKTGQSAFSVKLAFTDGGHTEHMWLAPVSYDGKSFHGTVNNDPEKVKTVRMGQQVTVEPSKISDWMYIENSRLMGGQTLRVLRNALTPAERADFDKNVPFVVD